VIYVAGMFQGLTLTWWNSIVFARGRDSLESMTWANFRELVIKKFCPSNEIQKLEQEFWELEMTRADHMGYTIRFQELAQIVPHLVTPESKWIERYIWGLAPQIRSTVMGSGCKTIQEIIEISAALTDDAIRSGKLEETELFGDQSGDENQSEEEEDQSEENQSEGYQSEEETDRVVRNCGVTNYRSTPYAGSRPKCNRCNYHHEDDCPVCRKCHEVGHYAKYCKNRN
jgi:hypothetical protein